jgi:hypothetical protein
MPECTHARADITSSAWVNSPIHSPSTATIITMVNGFVLGVLCGSETGEVIRESMQFPCDFVSSHRHAVAGCQHSWFEIRDGNDGLLRHSPVQG